MNAEKMMTPEQVQIFHDTIAAADTIAISGHTNPDGDCVGSALALCTYIRECFPEKRVDVYLDRIVEKFRFLRYADDVLGEPTEEIYDLFFCLDCSETDRLDKFAPLFERAKRTVCVDHHVSNDASFGNFRFVDSTAAATCEILFHLFEEDKISFDCAQCLYLGLVHDTGVFKHSNTTRQVMEMGGVLIEKGVRPERIIDDTFYKKTYIQNQILGRALMESILLLDGKIIFSAIKKRDMDMYGVDGSDMDGIIDQLRITEGVECAIFLYEKEEGIFKVSMRSNGKVNVSEIARTFGGGGHIKAAGCTMEGDMRDIVNNISYHAAHQLEQEADND